MRDLALFVGSLAKFAAFIILHSAAENRQNFGGRFACSAHDEDVAELSLVGAVRGCQGRLDLAAGTGALCLLLTGPGGGLRASRRFGRRFTDPRVACEGFEPIPWR